MDRYRSDSKLFAGPDYPGSNLPTVRNENFSEHPESIWSNPDRAALGAGFIDLGHLKPEQRLIIFDRLRVLSINFDNLADDLSLYLVHQLHGFNYAYHRVAIHLGPDRNKGIRVRRRSSIKGPYYRRPDQMKRGAGLGLSRSRPGNRARRMTRRARLALRRLLVLMGSQSRFRGQRCRPRCSGTHPGSSSLTHGVTYSEAKPPPLHLKLSKALFAD